MKPTTQKKMALLIVVTVFGLIGLDVLDFSQINRVFESTNYTNVNTILSNHELIAPVMSLAKCVHSNGSKLLTDKVKIAEIAQLMECDCAKVDLALKTYETAKRSNVSFSAERNDETRSFVLAATAEEKSSQAEQLQDLMSFFRVNNLASEANSVKEATTASKTNVLRKVMVSNNYLDKDDFVKF